MIAVKNHNSEVAQQWKDLAGQVQHHPGFLGYRLRNQDDASLAVFLGLSRVDVWRLKVCLNPTTQRDLEIIEAHFQLTTGALTRLLGGPDVGQAAPGGRIMSSGGTT